MDRKDYKVPFRKEGLTKFACPSCGKGLLRVKKDSFLFQETYHSKEAHKHEAWEPEWIKYVYSCLLECTNTACKDVVSSSGIGFLEEYSFYDHDGNTERSYTDYFIPKYFTPHLKIFEFPEDVSEAVVVEIEKSFSLVFSDPASSANHIRIALEHLLTHLKVKRFVTNKGKRSYLSLHNRIDLLPKKYDHIKEIFFAVKWLGNAGSHSNHQVNFDDVFDSYDLMIELLHEVFSDTRTSAKSLAKKINKNKGPK